MLKDPNIIHFKANGTQRIVSEYSTINCLINLQYFIVAIFIMSVLKVKILRTILDGFQVGVFIVGWQKAKFAVAFTHKDKTIHLWMGRAEWLPLRTSIFGVLFLIL